jgi:chloramphenicol 3-O phosphotransferase
MAPGTIIILNGTSSSGKTSILQAFQGLEERPFLDVGIDKFIWMLPKRYLNLPYWKQVFDYTYAPDDPHVISEIHSGPLGDRLISGMHQAIAALAGAGNHVIVDHVLLEERWLRECTDLFRCLNAYLVAVRCPLEIVEMRERRRKDRTLGQARAQFNVVHAHAVYDLEVDTSKSSPVECATTIHAFIHNSHPPKAFRILHGRFQKEGDQEL